MLAAYGQPNKAQIKAAKKKQALTIGTGCGMLVGLPVVMYCMSIALSSLINSGTEKLCLVEPQSLRPVVYGDNVPIGMSSSINFQVNLISALGLAFFLSFVQVALLKNTATIYTGTLGFSVLLLGFDLSLYLPFCALFWDAHAYQVCAGEYLPEVFGSDYMYSEEF